MSKDGKKHKSLKNTRFFNTLMGLAMTTDRVPQYT